MQDDRITTDDKIRLAGVQAKLADVIGTLEGEIDSLRYLCKSRDWDDYICYKMEDGCLKLGFVLATLTNWINEPEEKDDAKHEAD